jgi:aminoglycoside/choline kinase family phosphotransferase
MDKELITAFFEKSIQQKTVSFVELPASGSARKNFVITTHSNSYIVTYNENTRENEAFFYFTLIFEQQQLNTAKIFAISEDRKTYIQSYLGKNTLSEIIANEGLSQRVEKLVTQVLDKLYQLQEKTKNQIDYTKTFEYEEYNHYPILHDLNYFKFLFVDILGIEYHKSSLLKEFEKMADSIEKLQPKGCMIRDFQSRNILVDDDDQVFFIDYQSAMKGPLLYDVISFLYQAKANFGNEFKEKMLSYYNNKFTPNEQENLKKALPYLQLVRYLQVLGAYGFRGWVQKKSHFIESIPQGIKNLTEFSSSWQEMSNFPELKKIIQQLENKELTTT